MTKLLTPDRRGSDSNKWRQYSSGVIPLWLADMDYAADSAILQAIRARLDHPVLGYGSARNSLRDALVHAIHRDYDWQIEADWLLFLPGVEPGFNMALHAFTRPGDALLQELPVYSPLRASATHWGLRHEGVYQRIENGQWISDTAALAAAAPSARAYILCNPQNPTGRVYTASELEDRAELCLAHGLTLISDEIHCGMPLDGRRHIPIASLSPEIARQSVTLMSASKTWNVAGLKAAFAIVPDPTMRQAMLASKLGMVDSVNILGLAAMEAAYSCVEWRAEVQVRLVANRDLLCTMLRERLPAARLVPPQAGFLAWIDFSACNLPAPAAEFFLDRAQVALSGGSEFGRDLEAWTRLNYATSPELLSEALDRMVEAVEAIGTRTRA